MKTNITIDNYEAYLLDYLEGNLGPDEAEQLKAFVAAQGLDWNELTEELPHLEAPQIEFENKERLRQRPLSPEPVEGSKGQDIPATIAHWAATPGVLAWKMPGAGGGGYLALVVDDAAAFSQHHPESIRLKIRRK
jgi:hypothetical protein